MNKKKLSMEADTTVKQEDVTQSQDIFDSVPKFGIQDLETHHSFTTRHLFLPFTCHICKQLMFLYPYASVVCCLKCNMTIHRQCIHNVEKCSKE